jgi:hypothetical protein
MLCDSQRLFLRALVISVAVRSRLWLRLQLRLLLVLWLRLRLRLRRLYLRRLCVVKRPQPQRFI